MGPFGYRRRLVVMVSARTILGDAAAGRVLGALVALRLLRSKRIEPGLVEEGSIARSGVPQGQPVLLGSKNEVTEIPHYPVGHRVGARGVSTRRASEAG